MLRWMKPHAYACGFVHRSPKRLFRRNNLSKKRQVRPHVEWVCPTRINSKWLNRLNQMNAILGKFTTCDESWVQKKLLNHNIFISIQHTYSTCRRSSLSPSIWWQHNFIVASPTRKSRIQSSLHLKKRFGINFLIACKVYIRQYSKPVVWSKLLDMLEFHFTCIEDMKESNSSVVYDVNNFYPLFSWRTK